MRRWMQWRVPRARSRPIRREATGGSAAVSWASEARHPRRPLYAFGARRRGGIRWRRVSFGEVDRGGACRGGREVAQRAQGFARVGRLHERSPAERPHNSPSLSAPSPHKRRVAPSFCDASPSSALERDRATTANRRSVGASRASGSMRLSGQRARQVRAFAPIWNREKQPTFALFKRSYAKKASAWENMLYCVLTVFVISTSKSRPSRKPVSPMPNRMVNGCCSGGGT